MYRLFLTLHKRKSRKNVQFFNKRQEVRGGGGGGVLPFTTKAYMCYINIIIIIIITETSPQTWIGERDFLESNLRILDTNVSRLLLFCIFAGM